MEEPQTLDFELPPNLDEDQTKSRELKLPSDAVTKEEQNRVTTNIVFQFWQYLFSIVFLQWLQSQNSSKRPKALANEPATANESLK